MRVNRLGVYVSTDSAAGVYASSVIRVNGLGRGRAPVSISEGLPTAAIAAPERSVFACTALEAERVCVYRLVALTGGGCHPAAA